MTSLNEAMASCVPWQVPGAANYAPAVPGATSVPAHRLDATLMTLPQCLAARSSARSPR